MRIRSILTPVLTAIAGVALLVQSTGAQSIYEGFKLTFPLFNTGSGFSAAWQIGGFNAFSAGYTAGEASLAFRGLATSPGRVIADAYPAINGATRTLSQPLGADNTTAYLSVLIQPKGTLNAGVFNGFFGVTLNGGSFQDLFVGKPGGGATEEYVIEDRGGSGQVSSGAPTVVGQTALLVVRADFLPGNDVFTLYVNPTPGEAEPATGTVKSNLNLGTVSKLGIYSTGAFEVDEIRVGATYADVTPRVSFAGTAGAKNCHGQSVSALAQAYGGLPNAAAALGFASVADLQAAVVSYCGN